jgi:hypothetical protein
MKSALSNTVVSGMLSTKPGTGSGTSCSGPGGTGFSHAAKKTAAEIIKTYRIQFFIVHSISKRPLCIKDTNLINSEQSHQHDIKNPAVHREPPENLLYVIL